MSSEVCPFCGKTYKRLKSHLPHCKAAASSKTPPTKHDVTVNQTSSSQRAAALTEPAAKGGKSTEMLSEAASLKSKKIKNVSLSPATPLQSASASSSSQSPPSSASFPPSTKKKKKKLSEEIKTATVSLSPTTSKPKKKNVLEAVKSKHASKGLLEGTRSASEDLPSGSTPFVADPLSSRTTEQIETKTNPDKDLVKDNSLPTKPKADSKMKVLKKKKAAQSLSTTKDTSGSLDSKVTESSVCVRDDYLVDNEGEVEDFSVNKMFLKSGSGHRARITLQDVKATLGRANTSHQSSRPSILSQIGTTDDLSSKIRAGTGLSPVPLPTGDQKEVDSCLVTTKPLSDQLPSTSSQHAELQSVKRKSSKQASLIPLRHDGSPQPELTSPATPLLSAHLLSQTKSLPHAVSMTEGLKVGRHMTGLPTISPPLTQFSSHHLFPLAPQTLPTRVETLRVDDRLTTETSQLGIRKQATADNGTEGALTQRSLGQVRLRELPKWLSYKTPSRPRDVVEMVQRGWQWYYKKYIDVKKGGVGGVGMMLAGYCIISYIWSYPHIKRDRWRKHH